MTGRIASLNMEKCFGFIRVTDRTERDYFFHLSAVSPIGVAFFDMEIGDVARFEPFETPKGPRALNVCVETKDRRRPIHQGGEHGTEGERQAQEQEEDGNSGAPAA